MARVGIVICNYNKAQMVCDLIQSVLESKYTDYDIFVADNASTDGSVQMVREKYGNKVTLVINDENKGGSGGFNAGMRAALAVKDLGKCIYDYLWCLDNDVLVDENALGELVDFLDKNQDCGMAGSRVDHMEAPDYVQQYGMTVDFEQFATVAKYRNHPEDGTLPEVVYSDAVAACSVLVRVSLINSIGVMPEDNFLYWDDTEWGMRCNRAGFKVASVGKSIVLHCMGAKKENVNTFPTYYAWRNWIDFFMRYTEEDNLDRMCMSFLNDIFDIQYCGLYNEEFSKAKTVMLAYDDALHGVRGKAAENRILEMDRNFNRIIKYCKGYNTIKIVAGEYISAAESLEEKIKSIYPETDIIIVDSDVQECECVDSLVIQMCNYIFTSNLLDSTKVFADTEGNLYKESEDELFVFNYPYARKLFIESQLPLFMSCAMKIREIRPI